MALTMKYATKQQLLTSVRERYKSARGHELISLASKIKTALDAGDFTDAEMRAVFNATPGEWASIKARMNAHAANNDAINNAIGE